MKPNDVRERVQGLLATELKGPDEPAKVEPLEIDLDAIRNRAMRQPLCSCYQCKQDVADKLALLDLVAFERTMVADDEVARLTRERDEARARVRVLATVHPLSLLGRAETLAALKDINIWESEVKP
jgi:hypothetical protein